MSAALSCGAFACSNNPGGFDTGDNDASDVTSADSMHGETGVDSGAMDTGAHDTGVIDTGMHDGGVDVPTKDVPTQDVPSVDTGVDGSTGSACDPSAVLNLNTVGMRTGNTVSYSGSNGAAPSDTALTAGACAFDFGHTLVFTYTPTTTTRLRVSTDDPATTFDTVVWARTTCSAGGSELGCNDDNGEGTNSTFVTDTSVTAGTTIYIVVAGYADNSGTFRLSVTEITESPVGGACDPAGTTSVCASGSSCVGTGSTGVCTADGAAGGLCRATDPACDAMLACNGDPTDPTARCVATVAVGGACDPAGTTSVCATGSTCLGASGSEHCVADGAVGGLCRDTGTPCDSPSVCNGDPTDPSSRCIATVAVGGACDPTGGSTVCDPTSECRASSGGTGYTCQTPPTYVESAPTGLAFVDACAVGMHVASLTDTDDGHTTMALTIPFTFQFYGQPFTQIWGDTNGFAVFGPTAPDDSINDAMRFPLPSEGAVVAPMWSDLVLRTAPGSDLCYATTGTAPARHFVLEWLDAYRYGDDTTHLTFELVLNEVGNSIDFVYSTLSAPAGSESSVNGTHAVIGLQSPSGRFVTQHSGGVTTSAAVRFTPM